MWIVMYVIWSIIAVVAIIVELHTQYQIGWATSIASIAALITHATIGNQLLWVEFVVFFAVWSLSWFTLFLFYKKIKKKVHDNEDGYLEYINKTFSTIKGNDGEYGELKINSKIFRFKSEDDIKTGDKVIVKSIKGVTFIVKKVGM